MPKDSTRSSPRKPPACSAPIGDSEAQTPKHRKPPGPRHCKRCPGKPLASQCEHTKLGKAFLAAQAQTMSNGQENSQTPINSLGRAASLSLIDSDVIPTSTPAPTLTPAPTPTPASTPTPSPTSVPSAHISPLALSPTLPHTAASSPAASTLVELPVLPQTWSHMTALPLGEFPADERGPDTDEDGMSSDEDEDAGLKLITDTDIDPSLMPASKWTRATKNNPKHGFVEGAMRGEEDHRIVRSRPLRRPQTLLRNATRRFRRELNEIIARAERISAETNCWIFIGGQHPNASASFLHYASPRFRSDAFHEVGELTNHFGEITAALIKSRREEAHLLAQKLVLAEKEKKTAEDEAQASRIMLLAKQKEADVLLEMVLKYDPNFVMPTS